MREGGEEREKEKDGYALLRDEYETERKRAGEDIFLGIECTEVEVGRGEVGGANWPEEERGLGAKDMERGVVGVGWPWLRAEAANWCRHMAASSSLISSHLKIISAEEREAERKRKEEKKKT